MGESRPVVSVAELQRAWRAVQDGRFRTERPTRTTAELRLGSGPWWEPTEPVVTVLGGAGRCGASTTALLLATAAATDTPTGHGAAGVDGTVPRHTRVVECTPPTGSSLAAAATAELGEDPPGWWTGTRRPVRIDRLARPVGAVDDLPLPPPVRPESTGLTVLDVSWPLEQVLAGACWPARWLHDTAAVVLVVPGTVPGLRRLETALAVLGGRQVTVVVTEGTARAWTSGVRHTLGPRGRDLDRAGHVVVAGHDRRLAVFGIDSTTLPQALVTAAAGVLRRFGFAHQRLEGTA